MSSKTSNSKKKPSGSVKEILTYDRATLAKIEKEGTKLDNSLERFPTSGTRKSASHGGSDAAAS